MSSASFSFSFKSKSSGKSSKSTFGKKGRHHVQKKEPINFGPIWSYNAYKPHRYNRMDPDPDPPTDEECFPRQCPTRDDKPELQKDSEGNIKKFITREDWRAFWVTRMRKHAYVPNLTDTEIANSVERTKRVYQTRREQDRKFKIDPDLPSCYYWNEQQVAEWAETIDNIPDYIPIKDVFLNNNITGRRLITVDATTLEQLGIFDLEMVKTITQAIRSILGLPSPNQLRALARTPPLELFLREKIRTGIQIDKFTFKDFCKREKIDYEGAKIQIAEGYKPMPPTCQVMIEPGHPEEVNWIPMTPQKLSDTENDMDSWSTGEDTAETEDSDVHVLDIPTVEDLLLNARLRNTVITNILNEIVERVFESISMMELRLREEKDRKREAKERRREAKKKERLAQERQQRANEIFKAYMDQVYSDFAIFNPDDRLRFITIIAEELVGDVTRAREILEDIDNIQEKLKTQIPAKDKAHMKEAVDLYVQSIMPLVVSAALKELEEATSDVMSLDEPDRSRGTSGYSAGSESVNDERIEVEEDYDDEYDDDYDDYDDDDDGEYHNGEDDFEVLHQAPSGVLHTDSQPGF